tara:strand:- start:273 stop:1046 length:774 start_codon:yes stop_codon:yes gene_type:complete
MKSHLSVRTEDVRKMPIPVRGSIQRDLRDGTLTGASPLVAVRGIGTYLEGRLRRALRAPQALTLDSFWRGTRRLTTPQVERVVHRALQNERANQCVSTRVVGQDGNVYHSADVNTVGYEACATLLNAARTRGDSVRYGPLPPRFPARARSAARCGCKPRSACTGACVRVGNACVPRATNARGFVGITPQPHQGEVAHTDAERAAVRTRAHRRRSPQRDPDSRADVAAGHARRMSYVRRGNRMWRTPVAKMRLPVVRR